MAVGRISGPLLKANLLRNGIDLAFETDLLYLDVSNQRIGIKTDSPTHDLQVNGTARTTNLIVDNVANIADIEISGNTISSANTLNLQTTGTDTVVYQRQLDVQDISIFDNTINTNNGDKNLELRPNGTGRVEIYSDLQVNGNFHATGNISADGDIQIGDADTDSITFNADITSDIVPDQTATYDLGTETKRWNNVWTNNFVAQDIDTGNLVVDGVDLGLRQGNIIYVASNGNDTNTGTHPNDPVSSIEQALFLSAAGDTVHVYPGEYQENFPLTVPTGVNIKGAGLRSVKIVPTVSTNDQDAFLLNGETTVEDLTVADFYYNSSTNTGHAFRFANGMTVTSRSPYVKNVSVITKGSVTTAEDPRGFNQGDAGRGVYLDGAVVDAASREAGCLFHSVTFITPGVDAVTLTNGVRVEWLNCFTYFADKSVYAFNGTQGLYGDGKTYIRLGGVSGGSFQAGDTVTFTSTDSSTVVTANVENVDGDVLIVDGDFADLQDFDTTPESISNGSGVTAESIESVIRTDFGAEVRMIGSASVYGNFGLYGDGAGVIVYAIGHNLAYIGNGKEVTNDPETVIQDNEVVEVNDAKIRYNSVDHKGDFRVGDLFYVNQQDGTVDFAVSDFTIDTTGGVTFNTGGESTFVDGTKIETGNWRISGNTVETLLGDANIDAASGNINLNDNVNITGNLDVTGNVTIGGNIVIGDEETDTIQFIAGIDSDLIPAVDSVHNLGTETNTWKNLWINKTYIDDIEISNNYIQTTTSNSDLELRASGTGEISIPENDVQIDNNLTVVGTSTLGNTNITGTVAIQGDVSQTGSSTITGDVDVGENLTVGSSAQFEEILINNNFITTTSTNTDLELRAAGTGEVLVPTNDVQINNNLTVNGLTETADIQNSGTVTANSFTTSDILIDNNVIETTLVDSDLVLNANGTGIISVPTSDVTLSQALTVGGATDVQDLSVTGTLTHIGDTTQTGNYTITGIISNGDIEIANNQITTTESNSDLDLRASGTGSVVVNSNDVLFGQDLTVSGTTSLQDTSVTGTITHTGNVTQTGNYSISGTFDNGQIEISGNVIENNTIDEDLIFEAAGTGEISVPVNSVTLGQDLTVNGSTDVQDLSVTGTIVHTGDVTQTGNYTIDGIFDNGNIEINNNQISTTESNSDLELRANGTGEILVPNNDVVLSQALTVNGSTDLKDLTVTGTIDHTGDVTQVGNYNQTGNTGIIGNLTVSSDAQFEDIQISQNVLQTTLSNSDLELKANGTGEVIVPQNDVIITQDLSVGGTITVNNITSSGTITANRFSTGDILIDDNFITTTLSNSDLELRANGTGDIVVPSNNVVISQDLTVNGDTTLLDVSINGTVTHTGNTVQTGNQTVTGTVDITGDLQVTNSAQFEDILIDDNFITTTLSNSDLELKANGTGDVVVPLNNVIINNDLTVNGTMTINDLDATGTITANSYSTGDILIDDNFITTTLSNSDLELKANGTGEVVVPSNDIVLSETLTVGGTTTLSDTVINGDVDHTGSTTHTGDIDQTGNIELQGNFTVSSDAQFEDITVSGNTVSTTLSNSDLVLSTNGSGKILIPDNDVQINNDLTVFGTVTVDDISASGTIQANNFTTGDILIDDNFVTTTVSNSDLELRAAGTGSIVIDDLSVKDATISTVGDFVIQPGSEYLVIDSTGALRIPVGTTSERPATPSIGDIRYNLNLARYEGYNGSNWIILQGVEDLDGDTKITAELSEGANDGIIRFYSQGNLIADLDETRLNVDRLTVDDIQVDGNEISTVSTNTDLRFSANGTGSVRFENFGIKNNTITNTETDAVTVFENTNNGYIKIAGTNGFVLPVGSSAQRPAIAYRETGMTRYNTDDERVEVFNGVQWISVAGAQAGLSPRDAEDLAIETVLYLG